MGGMVRVDAFAVFLGAVVVIAHRDVVAASRSATSGARASRPPEYFGLMLFSASGMVDDDDGQRPHRRVPRRSRSCRSRSTCSPRSTAAALSVAGSGHQVLRARRVLVGDLPLRHRARLRRHRLDVAHRDRRLPRAEHAVRARARCCAGIVLLLVGLGFKVAAVPFHMWTPDVYQGAPHARSPRSWRRPPRWRRSPRCCGSSGGVPAVPRRLAPGRVGARRAHAGRRAASPRCVQIDLKRLLAYSSIAHAGYVLMALEAAHRRRAGEAALFYLFVYTFMVIGSFAVVTVLERPGRRRPARSTGTAAWRARRPVHRPLLVLFLLAQAGIPLTERLRGQARRVPASRRRRRVRPAGDRCGGDGRGRVLVPAGGVVGRVHRPATARSGTGELAPGRCRYLDRARGHLRRDVVLGVVPAVFIDWRRTYVLLHVVAWLR